VIDELVQRLDLLGPATGDPTDGGAFVQPPVASDPSADPVELVGHGDPPLDELVEGGPDVAGEALPTDPQPDREVTVDRGLERPEELLLFRRGETGVVDRSRTVADGRRRLLARQGSAPPRPGARRYPLAPEQDPSRDGRRC
jgi:hypothetical protein